MAHAPYFKQLTAQISFPALEEDILKFWKDNDVFKKSLENTKEGRPFIFYDGPPFATGLPHYGHLLVSIIKDMVARYWTMQGRYVARRFGWDCHGLPVETLVEGELKLENREAILNYGVDKFNEACRDSVLRFTREWENMVGRVGRWVDFENDYKTMDPDYMESIWWVFKTLFDKGLIYEGFRVQPYCPRCATPLSNFETNQGYKDRKDPSITVKLKVKDECHPNTYLLIWTTTPWTLPANVAVAVHPNIEYVKIKDGNEHYILAKERLNAYYKNEAYEVLERFKGQDLAGLNYEPIFSYFKEKVRSSNQKAWLVVNADFVSVADGTGLVHVAPAFGEDDFLVGKKEKLAWIMSVNRNGCFLDVVSDFKGQQVKAADDEIVHYLKKNGFLVHKTKLIHSYPHCYRCEQALIYMALETWFCEIEPIKAHMIANNQKVRWVPQHIRDGRFGKWLEGARDWNISRNRFWGTPIPLWRCENKHLTCVGSRAELKELSGKDLSDLHKHFVDDITFPCPKCKAPSKRIEEVLDCWFESGAMPYAQVHYPFKDKENFKAHFPADFIIESQDQTRGWFYTLTVVSNAIFQKSSFKNVIVSGMILGQDGLKLSKSKKNFPDPKHVINKFGADALRLYLMNAPCIRGDDLKFSEDGLANTLRSILIPLWNSHHFFVRNFNSDFAKGQISWTPGKPHEKSENPLDLWILSHLQILIRDIQKEMELYELQKVVAPLVNFIDDLTNWYIRRSRRRFWKSKNDADKAQAYQTLYSVLETFVKVLAPFLPFVSETLYKNLNGKGLSVHLEKYPQPKEEDMDERLDEQMAKLMKVVFLGRTLRAQQKIKTRQPLLKLVVITQNKELLKFIQKMDMILKEELNIKSIELSENEHRFVVFSTKANFKSLGKRAGPKMKSLAQAIKNMSQAERSKYITNQKLKLLDFELETGDIEILRTPKDGLVLATEGSVSVALDITITPKLKSELLARELVNRIQNQRKALDLEISDEIQIELSSKASALVDSINENLNYILIETLGKNIDFKTSLNAKDVLTHEIEGMKIQSLIKKVSF